MRYTVCQHFRSWSAVIILIAASFAYAADINRVNNGATINIVAHGDNYNVTNSCGVDKMIPAKTVSEWSNFKANKPACLALATPPPSGGVWSQEFVEQCWDKYSSACTASNNCGHTFPDGQPCSTLGAICYKRTTTYEYQYRCL